VVVLASGLTGAGSARAAGESQTTSTYAPDHVPPVPTPVLSGVSLNPTSVVGGSSGQGTVRLSGPAPAGGILVTLASGALSPVGVPPSILVPEGGTSAVFTITTVPVVVVTSALIRAILGVNSHGATLTVTPGAAPVLSLTSLVLSPASVIGGHPSQGTVTLSGPAPASGVFVALSSNSSAAMVPSSVSVPVGSTAATFSITTSPVDSTVNAAIGAGLGGSIQSATLVISPVTPPPPSGAQRFVSTSGSDSNPCSESAPCASFGRAYQVAKAGETVEVAAGSYDTQTVLQTQPPKAAPPVTFRSASGAQVMVGGIQLGQNNGSTSGTSPSNLVFDGFDINGQFHASYSGVGAGASNITLENSHVYGWNALGPMLLLRDVVNFTAQNDEVGPACCQADGIQLAIRSEGNSNPQNVVFDRLYVHDIANTCSTEPRYPDCAGNGAGDGCTSCEHVDGIQAFGGQGITIRNSRFYNAGTQNIFLQSANGGTFSNVTIENTMVSTSYGSPTNSVSLSGPGVSVFSGFARFRNNTFQKDVRIYQRVLAPGTQVEFTNNIAFFRGDEGGAQPCTYEAGDGSTITPTYSHNLFGDKTCGATDLAGSPTYVNPNPATPDLSLASGSRGIDAGDPTNYTPTDIDGITRPQGNGPDIGAGER